ncbi:glucokinase regulatory protein-like [Babylonia areolata]|uniref:glucokinase regulatory protein-like n=1 Tax=Babylonia areolata TaxID=304850 RepID=UPI003FCFE13C
MDGGQQPITERPNPLSANIDILSPTDIVSTLQACDEEIFNGWQGFPGLFDERIQRNLSQISAHAASILKDASNSAIIFSGCGTSGRLGFLTARTFNSHLRGMGVAECYHNIMAGGDKALFTSQEAVEDDPVLGASLLQQAAEGKTQVLFFGITCGLSAPFVAGQLDYCLQNLHRFTPVLLGFNPAHLARNNPIEKWPQTFLEVTQQMEAAEARGQGFLLNPVVGPEPITGSSRMKSGTATKLLLESVLVPAHAFCRLNTWPRVQDYLLTYKRVWEKVYQEKSAIAALLQLAGTSLRQGGHVYYVGPGSLGILGLIDASECPPTYGSSPDDVRGFLEGGYETLGNLEGDLSSLGQHFQISSQDFYQSVVPSLTDKDLVIFISKGGESTLPPEMQSAACQRACIIVHTEKAHAVESRPSGVRVVVDVGPVAQGSGSLGSDLQRLVVGLYAELAVKWTLNAVSTGAHILKGKVFNNIMIDLKPSNVKLFHRAVGIIQRYSGLPEEECRDYLLRSLYDTDHVTEEMKGAPIAQHIAIGATKPRVVPTALLAALSHTSVQEAQRSLLQQPVLRQAFVSSSSPVLT